MAIPDHWDKARLEQEIVKFKNEREKFFKAREELYEQRAQEAQAKHEARQNDREQGMKIIESIKRRKQLAYENTRHFLKSTTRHFQDVVAGRKTMEARKADRDFYIGECILLQEYCHHTQRYSGKEQLIKITDITEGAEYGIMPGYVMISFEGVDLEIAGKLSKKIEFQRSNGAQTTQDLLSPTSLQS